MWKNKKNCVRKEAVGTVVSDRMDKTIVVEISRLTVHPVFKKTIRRFNKIKADDEKNSAKKGDVVKLREVRPISKDKRWRLVGIVKKAA
ncbi:MAG: 30S ribosomal protein S17 [Candidatus Omnitrophota bacterium]